MQNSFPSRALATVTDPASVNCHPALLQAAWITLKSARGQAVHIDRLAVTAHIIVAPRSPHQNTVITATVITAIDAARARCIPRIQARAAQLASPGFDGDAA